MTARETRRGGAGRSPRPDVGVGNDRVEPLRATGSTESLFAATTWFPQELPPEPRPIPPERLNELFPGLPTWSPTPSVPFPRPAPPPEDDRL